VGIGSMVVGFRMVARYVFGCKPCDDAETSELIASNKVEGTRVYNRQGENLGTVHNFMVNQRSGQVEYAVMSFGGFLEWARVTIRFPGSRSRMIPPRRLCGGYR
jgi:hypothetical protein